MSILGFDRLGTGEVIVCAIVSAFFLVDHIQNGLRSFWRRLRG